MGNFLKNNRILIVISIVLMLIPTAAGLILWNRLPQELPIHYDIYGAADKFGGRGSVVFGMPAILLAIHLLCIFLLPLDKRNRSQNKKVVSLVFLIVPFVSLYVFGIIYASALGYNVDVAAIMLSAVGLLIAAIGNYLPKCKQNSFVGIRIKWTLESEANWNAVHRSAGRIWLIGGLLLALSAFLPGILRFVCFAVIICAIIVIPCVHSYVLYKQNGSQDGE